jgi:hypothetical protein
MKSTKAILSDYYTNRQPITEHPKRLTKRMRKRFFGKGPAGKPGWGREMKRNQYRIWRSAAQQKERVKKGGKV